mmetsp:Transcript_26701/g.39673  ORF Transcript_26701/g.39673 Transcript_26701/m.39673 type:complete len:116 (+) Transcript_26701:189-536(+)
MIFYHTCIVSFFMFSRVWANYFREVEEMFVSEKGRQATNVLQEDLAGGTDRPKIISIAYPTTPEVNIYDIEEGSAESEDGTVCMILRLSAPDMELDLKIRCDEIDNSIYESTSEL